MLWDKLIWLERDGKRGKEDIPKGTQTDSTVLVSS